MKEHKEVVQLLKSWEYKNQFASVNLMPGVVQLLKSWEYKNTVQKLKKSLMVVQLLKSWEYKNKEDSTNPADYSCTVT